MKERNKKHGFKVPEGYFDSFSERLKNTLSDDRSALPLRSSYKEGFVVPEGYFDTVGEKIQRKLNKGDNKVIQLRPLKKYYLAAISVAATVLLLVGLTYNASNQLSFEDIANSDIENYFGSADLGLTTYEIAEIIPIDQLEVTDIVEGHLDQENVLEYLNENIDDFEALNLENDE